MELIIGSIDSLTRWGAAGWAWIPEAPDQVVEVEAVLDGQVISRASANQMRPDLAEQGKGSGRCGFVLQFVEALTSNEVPLLCARGPHGATVRLSGEEWSNIAGYVDSIAPWGAVGWAWMPAAPDRAIEVEAVLDGKVIGRAIADQMRADLVTSGRGSGRYGFTLRFDVYLEGGIIPEFRVSQPDGLATLQRADRITSMPEPVELAPPSHLTEPRPKVEGAIDSLTAWGATGWVWMPEDPTETVEVEAVLGDRVIGRGLAGEKRQDLAARSKGTGRCGFVLTFAEFVTDNAIPILRTSQSFGAVRLFGDEWSTVAGYVDAVATWGAVGWAWVPTNPEQSAEIEAVLDGKVIGRATADQMRADLVTSGRGTGRYGFTLRFDNIIKRDRIPEFCVSHLGVVTKLRCVETITSVLEDFSAENLITVVDAGSSSPFTRETDDDAKIFEDRVHELLVHFEQDKEEYPKEIIEQLTAIFKNAPSGRMIIDSGMHKTILRVGHKAFGRYKPLAQEFYLAAFGQKIFDYASALRILEYYVDRRSKSEARSAASFLEGGFELDAFAHVALSRLEELEQNRAEAVKHLLKAGQLKPDNAWLRVTICSRLLELEYYALAGEEINRLSEDARVAAQVKPVQLLELRVKAAVRQSNGLEALSLIEQAGVTVAEISDAGFLQIVHGFARFGRKESEAEARLIEICRDALVPRMATSEAACLAVIQTYLYKSDWEGASQHLAALAGLPVADARPIISRRFEVACHLGRLSEAQDIYQCHWRGRDDLNVTELILSMRYLAEMREWEEAADLASHVISRNMAISDDGFGILQLVRKSGQHDRFIRLLTDAKRTDASALHLLQTLVDDRCVQTGLPLLSDGSRQVSVSPENLFLLPSLRATVAERFIGFVCADRAYFLSVFTFFASVAINCASSLQWFVFVNDDVPEQWSDALTELTTKLGLSLSVIRESEFLIAGNGGPATYGLFSGGRALSRSAYFRIYAANWLLHKQRYERALYVDTDVICEGDLNPLLLVDMHGTALLARPEGISREVRIAAAKCGVKPDKYFNSGVLLFDLGHRDMRTLLEHAIWQSERNPNRLTFHDQCALNIGFAGEAGELPATYNYFMRPTVSEEPVGQAVLIHYLERPKPWDTLFSLPHRIHWSRVVAIVKATIPPEIYRKLATAALGLEPDI